MGSCTYLSVTFGVFLLLAPAVRGAASGKERHGGHHLRQLQEPNAFDNYEAPPWFGGGQEENGDGTPGRWTMPDWSNVDWNDFSLENFDWEGIEWTSEAWEDFMRNVQDAADSVDVCPILEVAVGIGQAFGIAGDCTCEGGQGQPLSIECGFKDLCLTGDVLCASAGLNFTMDSGTGSVVTSACLDPSIAGYEEICFSYKMERASGQSGFGSIFDLEHSCNASYGDQPCKCEMEDDLCLMLDCSAYLPGAKMDTCQQLAFDNAEDSITLMPRFEVFDERFNGYFDFESIDWLNLDWNNIDWQNFGFAQINWTSIDWPTLSWDTIFNNDMTAVDVCPILTQRVLGMDDSVLSSCGCNGNLTAGFNVQCSFAKQCAVESPAQLVAIAEIESFASADLCGDVDISFAFDGVGAIASKLCVDFANDVHPATCIEYSIPIADLESPPVCKATYGTDVCKCTIDQSMCVTVDCTAFEATAVLDQCQVLTLQDDNDLQSLIPRFAIPSSPPDDNLTEDNIQDLESTTPTPETSNEIEVPEVGVETLAQTNKLQSTEKSSAPPLRMMSTASVVLIVTSYFYL